jgi:hypothetical protein
VETLITKEFNMPMPPALLKALEAKKGNNFQPKGKPGKAAALKRRLDKKANDKESKAEDKSKNEETEPAGAQKN